LMLEMQASQVIFALAITMNAKGYSKLLIGEC